MFSGHYEGWRTSRMNGLDKYLSDDFLKGKTLLELGCGHADIGNLFYNKGCDVTSSEIRQEHLNVAKDKYPHLNYIKLDCDKDLINKKYDIILHWGVLYHIEDIDKNLSNVCDMCDYLFLETEVCLKSDDSVIKIKEGGYDQAYNNIGSRPSQMFVENLLTKNGFEFKLIKDPILNHSFHIYDWDLQKEKQNNNIPLNNHGRRRFWICWKSSVPTPLK